MIRHFVIRIGPISTLLHSTHFLAPASISITQIYSDDQIYAEHQKISVCM